MSIMIGRILWPTVRLCKTIPSELVIVGPFHSPVHLFFGWQRPTSRHAENQRALRQGTVWRGRGGWSGGVVWRGRGGGDQSDTLSSKSTWVCSQSKVHFLHKSYPEISVGGILQHWRHSLILIIQRQIKWGYFSSAVMHINSSCRRWEVSATTGSAEKGGLSSR